MADIRGRLEISFPGYAFTNAGDGVAGFIAGDDLAPYCAAFGFSCPQPDTAYAVGVIVRATHEAADGLYYITLSSEDGSTVYWIDNESFGKGQRPLSVTYKTDRRQSAVSKNLTDTLGLPIDVI